MRTRLTAIDVFCGVGGMSLGFEQAGFDVVGAFDCEQINVDTYALNFPNTSAIQADLSSTNGRELRKVAGISSSERVDVLFGGPPCQGFSLIGKRQVDDPRNLLLYHFARLVSEVQPRFFVLENVAGLLLGNAKAVLDAFLRKVRRNGYAVQRLQVLCASEYGVPQRRERVFILGCARGLELPDYPATRNPASRDWGKAKPLVWSAISDLPDVDCIPYLSETDVLYEPLGRATAYSAILRSQREDSEDLSLTRRRTGGLTGCSRTFHSDETIKRFAETPPGSCEPISRFHRLDKQSLANTLRAGTGPSHGSHTAARPIHPVYPRCITVREAARLHSFPDWFSFHPTKWHGFRQVGNAVPPLLARAVAREIAVAVDASGGRRQH